MRVSVIIPTLGDRESICATLDSLVAQDFPRTDFEVLIIGNLQRPLLREWVAAFQEKMPLRLFFTNALGVNRARNLGIEKSRGKWLVFLDDDCSLRNANYLSEVDRLHETYPDAAAIGGPYRARAGAGLLESAYIEVCGHWLEASRTGERETFNLVGGNVSYKREILADRWRFDPEIRFGGSETELHARFFAAGLRLFFFMDLALEHRSQLGLASFFYRAFRQGFAQKNLELRKQAPVFQTYVGQNPQRRAFAAKPTLSQRFFLPLLLGSFRRVFRWGGDWAQISVYEDKRYAKCFEFLRFRSMSPLRYIRTRLWLREFISLQQYFWDRRRS